MNVKLSPYWRTTAWTLWSMAIFIFIGLFLFHAVYADPGEILWIMVVCGAFYIFLAIVLPLVKWRALMTVRIEDDGFTSYYFKKVCCTVSLKHDVYYDFFVHREGAYHTKKCILVSNKSFQSLEPGVPHIHFFDTANQIAIPYDETTIGFFDLDNWYNNKKRIKPPERWFYPFFAHISCQT